jgi:programmed cell death protein 4
VRELKAPHFHHELVKRGVRIAMEEDGGRRSACAASSSSPPPSSSSCAVANDGSSSLDAMAALFVFLANNSFVSEYQVAKGVDRLAGRCRT